MRLALGLIVVGLPLAALAQSGSSTTPSGTPAGTASPTTPAAPATPAPAAPAPVKPGTATPAPATGTAQPGAAPGATPADAPAVSPQQPGESDASYAVRLKALEQRVDELKEKIFRSKARLNLLKETVLHGVIAGSRAVILHRNEMGGSFRLIKAVYAIDGAQIFAKADDSGALGDKKEFEIFNGSIVPGNHTVSVLLLYQGHGYGIFSYLKGYKFTVRSSHTFTAAEGKQTQLKVVGFEKGNVTTDLKDRPAIDFRVTVVAAQAEGASVGAPAK